MFTELLPAIYLIVIIFLAGRFLHPDRYGTSSDFLLRSVQSWAIGCAAFYLYSFGYLVIPESKIYSYTQFGYLFFTGLSLFFLHRRFLNPQFKVIFKKPSRWVDMTMYIGLALGLIVMHSTLPPFSWDVYKSVLPRALALHETGDIAFVNGIKHPMFAEFFLNGIWHHLSLKTPDVLEGYFPWKVIYHTFALGIFGYFLAAWHQGRKKKWNSVLLFSTLFVPILLRHSLILYTNLPFAFFFISAFTLMDKPIQAKKNNLYHLFIVLLIILATSQVRRLALVYMTLCAAYYGLLCLKNKSWDMRPVLCLFAVLFAGIWQIFISAQGTSSIVMDATLNVSDRLSDVSIPTLFIHGLEYFGYSFFIMLRDSINGLYSEEYLFFPTLLTIHFLLRKKKNNDWLFIILILASCSVLFGLIFFFNPQNILFSLNRYLLPIFCLMYYNELRRS